jgi:hypothetical protein
VRRKRDELAYYTYYSDERRVRGDLVKSDV